MILSFNKSTSKNYSKAERLAKEFTHVKTKDTITHIDLSVKEVYEKWDYFNELFWNCVDWKGTTIKYENMTYHSHLEKTRIFYAIQKSRYKWLQFLEFKISQLHRIELGEVTPEQLDNELINENNVDDIIDLFTIKGGQYPF